MAECERADCGEPRETRADRNAYKDNPSKSAPGIWCPVAERAKTCDAIWYTTQSCSVKSRLPNERYATEYACLLPIRKTKYRTTVVMTFSAMKSVKKEMSLRDDGPKEPAAIRDGLQSRPPKTEDLCRSSASFSLVGRPAQACALQTFYAHSRIWRMINSIVLCGSGLVPATFCQAAIHTKRRPVAPD